MTQRALILGLGRFGGGRAAAAFLAARGTSLRIVDRAAAETLATSVESLQTEFGANAFDWRLGAESQSSSDNLLDGIDTCVVNPAVRPDHPLLAAARVRGVTITQEANLFLEAYPGRTVFVTGTNGKSTTATLLSRCLTRAGHDVLLGGNIGRSLLETESTWTPEQVAILEISSAQLSRIDPLRHRVHGAIATRITMDHVDWHGSLGAYHSAKTRALAAADDFVVHAADDVVAETGCAPTASTRIRFRAAPPQPGEVGVRDGWIESSLTADAGRVLHGSASHLVGRFHNENLAAAFAAAHALGLDRAEAGLALSRVRPLRHRLQLLAEREGVRVYGNAVSTEVRSTVSALESIEGRIHWIGGGKSKTDDFEGFARQIEPLVASASLFGAAATDLATAIQPSVPTTTHENLEAALDAAWQQAARGDALLFSPGFASFDQFVNFRARAAVFERWVRGLLRRPGS